MRRHGALPAEMQAKVSVTLPAAKSRLGSRAVRPRRDHDQPAL
jgi:hypothetical protein